MKTLFKIFTYLLCFAVPTFIVNYYDNNIQAMSASDKRLAIIGGTLGVLIMAIITGIKKPSVSSLTPKPGDTRIIKDPGSGAERIFHWNDKNKSWESDDGTILDTSKLKDWTEQRKKDRKWQDEENKNIRKSDEVLKKINRDEKETLAKMEKENKARDKFAEKHGVYETTEKTRKEWLEKDIEKGTAERNKYIEKGNKYETIQNAAEWTQWAADTGVDIVDIVSLGTLKPVKYIYIGSRNLGYELINTLVNRKGFGSLIGRTITKTTIDITQDKVGKIGYKYAANGVGDGIKGAMDAEEGKKTEAFFKEGLKGTLHTGIEHGMKNVKLPQTSKASKIMKDTAQKSNYILGRQQAGELTQKTANGIRNVIRTNGAQQLAAQAGKNKDLLNLGLGKLSDGIVNGVIPD